MSAVLTYPGIPLSLALPAAGAAATYLNGRYGFLDDVGAVAKLVRYALKGSRLASKDRVNVFYRLEELATSPSSANRTFLLLPSETASELGERSQWTYAEAYETVLKYAAWLKEEFGVQKNEVVAIDFTNRPQFLWLWFALWSLGARPAFINSNLRDKAFVHCVRISTARLLLVDPSIREVLTDETRQELAPVGTGRAVDAIVLEDEVAATIPTMEPYRAPDDVRAGAQLTDTSLLIYTSGTTGLPKAANVPWLKPLSGLYAINNILNLTPDDRYYSAMPLYHSAASVLCVSPCLGAGCTYVMGSRFSPRTFMKQAAETEATTMQYIGEMCRYLLSTKPSPYDQAHKLRQAFGNGLRPDVWQQFKDRFNIPTIVEFYGATEGPGATINTSRNSFTRGSIGRVGLLGRILGHNATALLRFDHEADEPWRDPRTNFCTRCSTDEPGEMVSALDPAAVEQKFSGYLGNDKASSSKILTDVFKKGDMWYRTGDLIRRDTEGRYWFVDRIGDTFRWKGENVSTNEVAEALGTHSSIREANVYGVQLPGHDGRAGCAAVLLKDGFTFDERLRQDIAGHVRKQLPKYAVPLFLRLMKNEFEVTGTVKQTKVHLRNQSVNPEQMGEDEVLWLPNVGGSEGYQDFKKRDWEAMGSGQVKL